MIAYVLTPSVPIEVHSFHYINKGLVLLVLDVRRAPTRGICGFWSDL